MRENGENKLALRPRWEMKSPHEKPCFVGNIEKENDEIICKT